MSDPYVSLELLIEPIVTAFKAELEATGLFDKITEGQDLYTEGLVEAWVIPGMDRIESQAMHMVRHYMEMNVIVFTSAEDKTHAELRKIAYQTYDALMVDITHDDSCLWALPTLFHPGYMMVGDRLTVGVAMQFLCNFTQFYPLPS